MIVGKDNSLRKISLLTTLFKRKLELPDIKSLLRQLATPPTFSDPEKNQSARWLNIILFILTGMVIIAAIGSLAGIIGQGPLFPLLIADAGALGINLLAWYLMHRGHVRVAAFLPLSILFLFPSFLTLFIFRSVDSPDVYAYFVLIPLTALLLGKRSIQIVVTLCIGVVSVVFFLETSSLITPLPKNTATANEFAVVVAALVLSGTILQAAMRRLDENAEAVQRTAAALVIANGELQISQTQLQQARDELEERVSRRTDQLKQANVKLEEEISERQRLVDALRQSEANWRSLVGNVPEVIATIDRFGTIAFMNRSMDGRPVEVLVGKYASEFHTAPQFQLLLAQSIAKTLHTGETISYESEETVADSTRWSLNRVGAIKQEGEVTALILISTDITLQKQTQAAMHQTQKLESLGVLAGGVAHDFNNLLTAMLMQLSSASLKLSADHPVRRNIERSINAAERATELTKQMLNYAGRNHSETKPININSLITDNIHLFSAAIPKNITSHSQLTDDIFFVKGDKGQIQQLIMNLILNAADAIGQKNGSITVTTQQQEVIAAEIAQWQLPGSMLLPGKYIKLEVSDDGCGMDTATLARIFDPFFTTKFTGRGLGLASVLGIVRSHHGGLRVSSTVGKGTTFSILLPVLSSTTAQVDEVVAVTAPTKFFDRAILVIDDEKEVCEATSQILEEAGVQVITAEAGRSGIDLFRQKAQEIQLVLLDLSMPGMNGVDVFLELQKINSNIPVILVSGYSEYEVMDRFVAKGLAGFIQKPYSANSLLLQIQQHLPCTLSVQA